MSSMMPTVKWLRGRSPLEMVEDSLTCAGENSFELSP
jgi:hypothetical protein